MVEGAARAGEAAGSTQGVGRLLRGIVVRVGCAASPLLARVDFHQLTLLVSFTRARSPRTSSFVPGGQVVVGAE